jgi:enhancing lycopene biosynthesis protein 2
MEKKIKFAIVLSGCGVYDGSEIHESVLSMLAIAKNGCSYETFAPDMPQMHVINHITGDEMEEARNVLTEAARIARGTIKPLNTFDPEAFDALLFPGGFGAAKNLSDYAMIGEGLTVDKVVAETIRQMHMLGKPIAALCVTPVLVAKVIEGAKVTMGMGDVEGAHIESIGGHHEKASQGSVVIDKINKIVSAPCYMLNANITDIEKETQSVVKAVLEMIKD